MDGKNSSGRRISLLNDNEPSSIHRPSLSICSRDSSYASSPSSPQTPLLVRTDSSDSVAMQTPSPITPDYSFESMAHGLQTSPIFSPAFFQAPKELQSAYPPIPQNPGPLAYNTGAQVAYFQPPPAEQQSSANPRSKKNSYPCPMAKAYNCNDYFTTSGHAARHAKKHTGKKDAYCPECNKAFTRKDNMEQHRRTHQTGRNASKAADAKKAKQQPAKRPRPTLLQSSELSISALDEGTPTSPASSFSNAPAVQPIDPYMEGYAQRSPYPDPMQYTPYPGSAYGLDALAIAASSEKRKLEP
ncbi:hypothetical protein BU16DRAFT_377103 [Lophium mytilinum]|uniref:C2H2-type domain-containing protein n=1 Tax=Lophium mytilinum TaxID=390894 RepID=A0A6A6QW28_9PEZI|nr:hypothetical protein BU16DRAFT_377103 [Lophium mytilinum]